MRPWNARSNTTTPARPVAAREILTAFSIASAPEFTSSVFVAALPGQSSSSFSADRHVRLVGADHEALVEEAVDLLVDCPDDGRVAVTEVLAGDAAGEVDVLAPLGVPDSGAPGARDDEIGRRDAARDVPLSSLAHLVRGRLFLDPHQSGVSHYRNARQMGALILRNAQPL